MRIAILISIFYIGVLFGLQAQIQYTIQIERPDGIADSEIKELFGDYPDIYNIHVKESRLVLSVPNRDDYPVRTIRDILAKKNIAALDVETAPVMAQGAVKKSLETARFKVYGECGMCKDRIERAARSVNGVVMANWDSDTQLLLLKYLPGKTGETEIQQAIAAVGHDTEAIRATDEAYEQLHTCCKYERSTSTEK